jgi:hypothetical protein
MVGVFWLGLMRIRMGADVQMAVGRWLFAVCKEGFCGMRRGDEESPAGPAQGPHNEPEKGGERDLGPKCPMLWNPRQEPFAIKYFLFAIHYFVFAIGYFLFAIGYDRAPDRYDRAPGTYFFFAIGYDRTPGRYECTPGRYEHTPDGYDRMPGWYDRAPERYDRTPDRYAAFAIWYECTPDCYERAQMARMLGKCRKRAFGMWKSVKMKGGTQ